MTVILNFDASTIEPNKPFEPVPAGDYVLTLVAAEQRPTKAADGHYLHCDYQVQQGEYQGRHIFDNLNLWNKSQQASEIAWRQLSGLCHAANVLQVQTVDQLFGIPVVATVQLEEDDSGKYGPQNRIRNFSAFAGAPRQPAPVAAPPWGGTVPAARTAAPVPAPTAPPAPTGVPPWMAQTEQTAATPAESDIPPWAR